ncbi:MAG TPA: YbaB/EbfC family nucleoid-associated protein [Pseudonocardiaceae bacterium]|jgi:DNA-binding protein YbaB|nr:YbaB/EbfC family nucleoid-associated protein [Pseudonocardiaceae bacterium]
MDPNPQAGKPVDALVERYAGMKEEITEIRAKASSSDRSVTVVAGPGGSVLDVQLTEQALRTGSGRVLSSSIMSALRIAVADAAKQQATIVARYAGNSNVVAKVMAAQQEILGDKIAAGEQEQERLGGQQQGGGDYLRLYGSGE